MAEIEQHYVLKFTETVNLLSQQQISKLEKTCAFKESGLTGESASPVNQFGTVEMEDSNERNGDTNVKDIARVRRWYSPQAADVAVFLDNLDQLRINFDQKTPIVKAFVAAINRNKDRRIMQGFFGSNIVGPQGAGTQAFSNDMIVANSVSTSILTKIDRALALFSGGNVDIEAENVFMLIPSKVEELLLTEGYYISADYQDEKVLATKKLIPFRGVNFIRYNDPRVIDSLMKYTSGSDTLMRCPIYCDTGMAYGKWGSDYDISVDKRPDKKNNWQILAKDVSGGTRVEEEKCAQVIVKIS